MKRIVTGLLLALTLAVGARSQDWSAGQQRIIDGYKALSAATDTDGGGADAYADLLAPGFTRWTLGEGPVTSREELIEGVRDWWEDGWRVVDRKAEYREITIDGNFAFVRRIVAETYRSPADGETRSRTALAET